MPKVKWSEPLGVLTLVVTLLLVGTALVTFFDSRQGEPPEQRRWRRFIEPTTSEDKYEDVVKLGVAGRPINAGFPTLSVYSSPSDRPAASPVTLKDLSGQGQAHLIDLVAKAADQSSAHAAGDAHAAAAATGPLQLIAQALDVPNGGPEHKDPYRADRVLVASIAKPLDAMPGDRLLWTRVVIEPINFRFADFSVASTDTKTFKVADIEDERSENVSLDVGLEGAKPVPTLTRSNDKSRKASAELTEQVESLGIDIQPDALSIIRESEAGGNVVGNTKVSLSAITDLEAIWNESTSPKVAGQDPLVLVVADAHLVEGGRYLEAKNATLTVLPQEKLPHCALRARVRLLYATRRIQPGSSRSYVEGNQTVSIVRGGRDLQEVEIVPADDISPAVWTIKVGDRVTGDNLQAQTNDNGWHDLVFTDYTTASEVTHWLKTQQSSPVRLGEVDFKFDPAAKSKSDPAAKLLLTPAKLSGDECHVPEHPRMLEAGVSK